MSDKKQKLKVGLVMPIAAIEGVGEEHWQEVKTILIDALDSNGIYEFDTKIVSESDSVGLIHKRIVQGLYQSDIVICDVSCKNPNVMFELGMRLAFDKPTIIVKDDKTNFTFDAGVIEHLEYPRDLRFSKIIDFKNRLSDKVIATYKDFQDNPDHSTFLKSYGDFKTVNIKSTEVTEQTLIIDMLNDLQFDVHKIRSTLNKQSSTPIRKSAFKPASYEQDTNMAAYEKDIRAISDYINTNIAQIDFRNIEAEALAIVEILMKRNIIKTFSPEIAVPIVEQVLTHYQPAISPSGKTS